MHRIRKQVMDLSINGRLDAFRTQHLAGPFYYHHLVPALEKIFNELAGENEIISIDKLELDLGIIPVHELEAAVPNALWESIIRRQVMAALQDQRKNANIVHSTTEANSCMLWLFYMEHGYLAWKSTGFDEKQMADILETLATDYMLVLALRKLIRANQHARVRIIRNHSGHFLVSLVEILTAVSHSSLPAAVNELVVLYAAYNEKILHKPIRPEQIRQQIWMRIIEVVSEEKTSMHTTRLVEEILLSEDNLPALREELQQEISNLTNIYPAWKDAQQKKIAQQHQKEHKQPIEKDTIAPALQNIQHDKIDEQGIFISCAGLALLHPFLATLFKRLNLVAEGKFINTAASEKAVHLLHYLATGNTSAQEHELAMPKLLCALPLHYALKETIVLEAAEKEEAENMLLAAIEKWEKLKNVSIDALRENFLLRSGKLYMKNDLRYLQVESSALDVLLDYLPWTLSIIKLPWMKEILRIEWR